MVMKDLPKTKIIKNLSMSKIKKKFVTTFWNLFNLRLLFHFNTESLPKKGATFLPIVVPLFGKEQVFVST